MLYILRVLKFFHRLTKRQRFSLIIAPFLIITLIAVLYFSKNTQDVRKKAREIAEIQQNVQSADFSTINSFTTSNPIYSLKISGKVILNNQSSFVRVVLIDKDNNEYLIYESYPLIAEDNSFMVADVCEETCVLPGLTPKFLRIEGNSSTFDLTNKNYTTKTLEQDPQNITSVLIAEQQRLKNENDLIKINLLSRQIPQKGLQWIAGETEISKKFYAEKKKLFSNPDGSQPDHLPNLQGFEYYKGGIFEKDSPKSFFYINMDVETPSPTISPSPKPSPNPNYPLSWDWRNRHGENWLTTVKNQGVCASCWVFAATAATEADANLYFNQHLDFDLSEQDALSCSNGGNCSGGVSEVVLDYYRAVGAVNESCFPYTASNAICKKCDDWTNQTVKISGKEYYFGSEDWFKKNLIKKGVISAGIQSWRHSMALVGWETDPSDNQTVWIFKNSWGNSWGEQGYGKIKMPLKDFGWTHAIYYPITVVGQPQLQIACVDKDNDGYCNWGISELKPTTCPTSCKPEKDCDDSNPDLGPFDNKYNCVNLTFTPTPTPTISEGPNLTVVGDPSDPNWKWFGVNTANYTNSCGSVAGNVKVTLPVQRVSKIAVMLKWTKGGGTVGLALQQDGTIIRKIDKTTTLPKTAGEGWVLFDVSSSPVLINNNAIYRIYLKKTGATTVYWFSKHLGPKICDDTRAYQIWLAP